MEGIKTFFNKAVEVLTVLFLVAALIMAGPCLLGWLPRMVISGSMEPEIPVGSLVYLDTKVRPEEIEPGDIISYEEPGGRWILHRVIETDRTAEEFRTKGDANETPDLGAVDYQQYTGKLRGCIPIVGYLAAVCRKPLVWMTAFAVWISGMIGGRYWKGKVMKFENR